MNDWTKLLLAILLPILLWSIILLIQIITGHFLPPILIGLIAAITGIIIGTWLAKQ